MPNFPVDDLLNATARVFGFLEVSLLFSPQFSLGHRLSLVLRAWSFEMGSWQVCAANSAFWWKHWYWSCHP